MASFRVLSGRPQRSIAIFSIALVWSAGSLLLTGCDELPPGCRPGDLRELAKPPEKPPTDGPAEPIQLAPTTLRRLLLEGNTSVLLALNRVHQAKDSVNIARGNLLPSLNLSALLFTAKNPAFALSAIDFLLPFLLPAKWFEYLQAKNLLEAEKLALHLLKLNTLASAYSLLLTVASDQMLLGLIEEEARDLAELEAQVEDAYAAGLASAEDLNRARGQTQLARIDASKVAELVWTERAMLRHSLGLPPQAQLSIALADVAAPEAESQPLPRLLEAVLAKSYEAQQLEYLKKAAKYEKWKQIFSFLSGSDIRISSGSGRITGDSFAFSNVFTGANVGLGFAWYPAVQLSHRSLTELELRSRELGFEITEVLEGTLGSVTESKRRLEAAARAEGAFREVYEINLARYEVGLGDLRSVLEARGQLRMAQVETLRAATQLAVHRITLHRMTITDQFAAVQGCGLAR